MIELIKDYIKSIILSALAWGIIFGNAIYRLFIWLLEIKKSYDVVTGEEIIHYGLYSFSNISIYYILIGLVLIAFAIYFGLMGIVFMLDYEYFKTQMRKHSVIFLFVAIGITILNIIIFK